MHYLKAIIFLFLSASFLGQAQKKDHELTEVWEPDPPVVTPGSATAPPSDAIVLFDGSDFDKWETPEGAVPEWTLEDGAMTVKPGAGVIQTKQGFGDMQLHVEWRSPEEIDGDGQGRGNSGVFLMGRYEIQVLDCYNNSTYPNGQTASVYKQHIPLANACRKPGEWQTYDIIFTAPRFNEEGRVTHSARVTVLHNGVLVQNNVEIWGTTQFVGLPQYKEHDMKEPILLQDHSDLVSFRNIWVREL
ncbi:MAG: 3-keto-disaccharide hydrolase [Marinilabiliaceae bacterium]